MAGYGAFGKMPSLGDFFRINAPSSFVAPWDAWLQQGMMTAQEALAERWSDCYMSAPIWRFTLSQNLAGPSAVLGVLMPSVDRVGRMFPLTLMLPLADGIDALDKHRASNQVFHALEDIALDTLNGNIPRAELGVRLEHLARHARTTPPVRQASHQGHGQSVWTAVCEQGTASMTCGGLPKSKEILGLFDLNAPIWGSDTNVPEANL